jgi:HPr kinase/phosphorylase
VTGEQVHGTAVALDGAAVLLLGAPGSGKSDLALRLIDRGWELVADDRVDLAVEGGMLVARAPAALAGRIEMRGVGIVARPFRAAARLLLAIRLGQDPERLPPARASEWLGIEVPVLFLKAFDASAPLKAEEAMRLLARGLLFVHDA